ncbi:hypothetical protein D9757_013901 [Collybiopsis confluens]|uniref:Uncharacterized protein n=1 Tax=Collybiopsis confluens TaxID=2823264 RepID=A0A8H5FQ64_9AGAR|nr:hypothetical protein D9757_013901 [Collybiopsis confluens]
MTSMEEQIQSFAVIMSASFASSRGSFKFYPHHSKYKSSSESEELQWLVVDVRTYGEGHFNKEIKYA